MIIWGLSIIWMIWSFALKKPGWHRVLCPSYCAAHVWAMVSNLFWVWSFPWSPLSTFAWSSPQWWWIVTNIFSYSLPASMGDFRLFFRPTGGIHCGAHDRPHPLIVQGCLLREIEDIEHIFLLRCGISHSKIEPLTAAAVFAARAQYHQTKKCNLHEDPQILPHSVCMLGISKII